MIKVTLVIPKEYSRELRNLEDLKVFVDKTRSGGSLRVERKKRGLTILKYISTWSTLDLTKFKQFMTIGDELVTMELEFI